jgi:hypothetical protein
MKTARDLNDQFQRLEAAGNNDFELIMLGGPDAYATHELSQLLRQLKVRRIRARQQQRILFQLAIMLPVFLVVSLLFIAIDRIAMVRVALGIATAIALIFAWKAYSIRQLITEVSSRDIHLYKIISHELVRRRELA